MRIGFGLGVAVAMAAVSASAQEATPGVSNPAPGVQVIDGAKVPSIKVDVAALQASIATDNKFAAARKQLGGDGIVNVGPGGSIVHMYKVEDMATNSNKVLLLFVKGGKILNVSAY